MNIGIFVPIGGNPGIHERVSRYNGDWTSVLAEIGAMARAIGAKAVQLHNPGLGPTLPSPTPGVGPGDPESSRMPMNQPIPTWMDYGIRKLIDDGLVVHVYVGSPHHSRPHEFTIAGMRAALDQWLLTGAYLILDHAADAAAEGVYGAVWLRWINQYARESWGAYLLVEPESVRWPWWAPSHRITPQQPATNRSIVLVQRPAPGPYDAPKDIRIAWVLGESARFIREGFAGEVQIPLYVAEALANDPDRLEAWRAACRPQPPATT